MFFGKKKEAEDQTRNNGAGVSTKNTVGAMNHETTVGGKSVEGGLSIEGAKSVESRMADLEKKEKCVISTLGSVNELLQYMTGLDYVKEMISNVNTQSEMIETVAASSEEMASATEDISNYVQDSNRSIQDAMARTESSLNKVDETFEKMERQISEIEGIKAIMTEVTGETEKINELVNVIKSVAVQTNLLSLNASIEAARAGEQGRGFAVVANEIKKLAENTKDQVDIIRSIVEGLNGKITMASSEIDRLVGNFSGSKEDIDQATAGIHQINTTMKQVEESFTSISANVEEQTATTQEMSSNLQIINEKSYRLRDEANRTGQAFFDISMQIDRLRVQAFSCAGTIDKGTMVALSITDHLMWKWRVYNMILGYVQLDVATVGDHKGCRLGKWVATLDQKNPNVKRILDRIEKPHSEIHKDARTAITEFQSGNRAKAEELLSAIERNSAIVVAALTEMGKSL